MQEVDLFVMDYWPAAKQLTPEWIERGQLQKTAATWLSHIIAGCQREGIYVNLKKIANEPFEDGLDFTVRARKHAFDNADTEIFMLSDNDMLPYDVTSIRNGIDVAGAWPGFAILSAYPVPHTIKPLPKYDRPLSETSEFIEHYSCGGFRFCRRLREPLVMPECTGAGYDGVFCRYLWNEHGQSVGYLKQSRAFHLGTHCTSLWSHEATAV